MGQLCLTIAELQTLPTPMARDFQQLLDQISKHKTVADIVHIRI